MNETLIHPDIRVMKDETPSIPVLDHGFVNLVDSSGGDISVVNAARVSVGKRVEVMSESDMKLIGFLMRERHGTPFEHNFMSFRVKAPIFIFREWHRHRVGISINEISGRYTELSEETYKPRVTRVQTGRPGQYQYQEAPEGVSNRFWDLLSQNESDCFRRYHEALARGVAREHARLLLPLNTYSEMIWTCNARSLMHFLTLRGEGTTAMRELQLYSNALEYFFGQVMPVTYEHFRLNERRAP